ncbi:NADP-dependent oxidoreductase [Streptomyces millisiae]|uniref:NADP-dependent oxidoreductase n=1 Tax=Streptomyces millisiae TaxID=3075542 RepID=A0ABU2LHF2_9ACTN|nr:NADP-dependent oxidoreductase [Streptomyces sp. DSM 44918]MDT0317009.1 NADP-dependent oxidoreductase [Streptomyces sp. DSM 44918]
MSLAYCFTAYGGPEVQRFLDVTVPAPARGEVLVRVHAAGVNPVDWKVRAGMHRSFLPLVLPAVLGREVAGVVVRTGPGVDDLAVGDRVFGATVGGSGGYAELALMPAARTARVPAGVPFVEAAALPIAAGTAHGSLAGLAVAPGDTVLVLGAGGGVGTMATQLAAIGGATVVGTASAGKRVFVESLGATAVAHDEDDVEARLRELLPDGPDAVLDLVGGDALLGAASLLGDRTRVLGVTGEPLATRFGVGRLVNVGDSATLSALAGLVGAGRLDPRVHRVFPFVESGNALALVESGHVAGKVVIDVAGDR